MQLVDKLTMFMVAVSDMPKAKTFYADTLGLKVTNDYRQDDNHWWVSLALPEGITITLTTFRGDMKPGSIALYFATSDITAAHRELSKKAKVNDIQNDLYGPGSGVKFFILKDPDGTQVHMVQA